MALFDDIKSRLAQRREAQQAAPGTQQAALQTKATGKAAAEVGPKVSTEAALGAQASGQQARQQQAATGALQAGAQEQAAQGVAQRLEAAKAGLATQRQAAQQQLGAQSRMAGAARAGQADIFGQQVQTQERLTTEKIQNAYEQRLQELALERDITVDNIFEQYRQSNKELAFRKDAAELEQLAHTLAMRDKQYLQELNNVARINQLGNELEFKKEAQRLIMGAEFDALIDSLGWQEAFNQDARDFKKEMADLSLEEALKIHTAEVQARNTQALISGATAVVSAYGSQSTEEKS